MTSLADLHRAVEATLASKRLGVPVFARYQLHSRDRAASVPGRLGQMVAAVCRWLDQALERVYALGTVKSGQVSLTLELRGGATAVVSWAAGEPHGSGIDLLILGNHGALYHDAGTAELWDEAAAALAEPPGRALLDLLERALRSGRPEAAAREGGS